VAKAGVAKTGVAKTGGPRDGAKVAKTAKETKDEKAEHEPVVTEVPAEVGLAGDGEAVVADAPKAKRARATKAKKTEGADDEAGTHENEHAEGRGVYLEHQRLLLMAERRNYTRQAEELRAQADALALEHEPGDVQFDEEGGEGGTANVDRELDLHLSAQAQAAIEEIDAALDKITAGTYGLCESCGSPVPKARLEVLPHARLCVSCKSGGLSARRQ
jgi:DnaK suppressor protein